MENGGSLQRDAGFGVAPRDASVDSSARFARMAIRENLEASLTICPIQVDTSLN